MPDELRALDKQEPIELATDFLGEDRHEFGRKTGVRALRTKGSPLRFA